MVTSSNTKATGSSARAAESDDDKHVSQDVFANPADAQLTSLATVEDRLGVERIVVTSTDGWTPAPMEADPRDIAAAEEREKRFEAAKAQRLANSGPAEDA